MAALRLPWSKCELMRRRNSSKASGPFAPFSRLRFTCRKKSSKALVRSKVEDLSGVMAL